MIKLNCGIRSTQNWKAPDKVSTLFRKGNKHRQVQNPPRISWGTFLFTEKESSPAEISDQLSLSPATGSVMCSCRVSKGLGDSSSLHGPLRWGLDVCVQVLSAGVAQAAGWMFASQPRWTHPMWTESSSFLWQAIVPRAQSSWTTGQLELDGSFLFLICFPAQTHRDKPVVWSFHYKDIPSRYRNGLDAPTAWYPCWERR